MRNVDRERRCLEEKSGTHIFVDRIKYRFYAYEPMLH